MAVPTRFHAQVLAHTVMVRQQAWRVHPTAQRLAAGRTGPGRALRLWDPRDRLRPQREPEIRRVDLASALLDVMAWGESPDRFEWFEAPDEERLAAARTLLRGLGAVESSRITPLGEALRRFPLHPGAVR